MSLPTFDTLAEAVLDRHRRAGTKVATAESCTGGMVAAALTAVAGSSDVFERGFVVYSNAAKTDLLGVPADLVRTQGAVSHAVAAAMAEGALAHSQADVAVSITGIAGPGGGSADKPVGLVYIGAAARGHPAIVERHVFAGDRAAVRAASAERALTLLLAGGAGTP
ncbi:MAG: CinA family protein [Rhodospirillaceae bacterium]|nr:CinA family protein [Rhodospirillaceae bacterium]